MNKYFTLDKWVSLLKNSPYNTKLFGFASLLRLSNFNENRLRKALLRLEKRGLVKRVGAGLYLNTLNCPSIEEMAMVLYRPCYISYESALSHYGLLSQMPLVLLVATTKKPSTKETPVGTITSHHIKDRLFFGYIEKDGILYAEPEKALLDWVYSNIKIGAHLSLDEIDWTLLNVERLYKYGSFFPKSMVAVIKKYI